MIKALFEISASSTILNPYYFFPPDRNVEIFPNEYKPKGTILVETCKMSLQNGITILFNHNRITFFNHYDKEMSRNVNLLIEPLWYFIIFKTFIDYNVYAFPQPDAETSLDVAPETERVHFNLGRVVKKEIHNKFGKGFYHETEPYVLELEKKDIEGFLTVVNYTLYLAISYYLIGCRYERYFLIEYYKSLEAIKNYFGKEKEMQNKLRPYGFSLEENYKKLTKYANDQQRPLNIGRHAPRKDARIFPVNLRRLLDEPRSKEIFEESSNVCRNMINMFIDYLEANVRK